MSTERCRGGRKQRTWMSRRADFLKEERHQQGAEEEDAPAAISVQGFEMGVSSDRGSGSAEHPSGPGGNRNNKVNVGLPPAYDGSREAGAWEEYHARAKLWFHTTTLDGKFQGPHMLQMLSGNAFNMMRIFAEFDEWYEDPKGGWRILEKMSGIMSSGSKITWLGELEDNLHDDYEGTSSKRKSDGSDRGEDADAADDSDTEILEAALGELDAKVPEEITEDEAREVLMTLVRNKYRQGPAKQQRRAHNSSHAGKGKRFGKGIGKKEVAYLKSFTKCKGCGQKGHWHKDAFCPKQLCGDGGETFTKNQSMALDEALHADDSDPDDIAPAMEKLGSALNPIRE